MLLIEKFTKYYLLDYLLLLLPISLVLGNAAINILCLLVFFSLIINSVFNKHLFYNKKNYFFFSIILILILFLNIIFSNEKYISLITSIGIIRYFIIFLSLLICFENSKEFRENFFKLFMITLIFVILDTYIQYFFKKDIFGYIVTSSHGDRLSGPFGDELVVGSFISKTFFVAVIYLITKSKNLYLYSFSFFSLLIVILSNERSASIMLFSSLIIFYFLWIKSFKYKILSILGIAIIFFLLLFQNKNLNNHFIKIPMKYFSDNHHKAHFLTGFEIFNDNKIFGSGLKTFRYVCSNSKYEKIKTKYANNRCATHPHNIYIEVLSETGLAGMLLLVTLNLYIFIYFVRKLFARQINDYDKIIFAYFFLLFFPLQTTGSLFSTWNGIFYWIFYAFFFINKKKLTFKSI